MGNANFDWLTIDMEHNSNDPYMMQTLIAAVQSKDIAALVRVSKNEEVAIKHAMDAGADVVIVPMVNSKEDAAMAVAYAKYPPQGRRGVGLSRAQNYGLSFEEYKNWLSAFSVVIAQIEHVDGIHNIDEIINTPGIDAVMIGPYDLSASMGFPGAYDREDVQNAIVSFNESCIQKGFSKGYHVVPPKKEKLQEAISKGYNFIAFSTDFLLLNDNIAKILSK